MGLGTIKLILPDLPSLPMGVGIIPFSFHVLTHTKPVHQEDLEHKHDKLFPAPPASSAEVELVLHRRGHMRARGKTEEIDEKIDLPGSLGDKAAVGNVRTRFDEPEFTPTPDHKNKGIWKRGVHFEGVMTIPEVPTFRTETVEWNYFLKVKMDFPGPGNILELEFPIGINSGVACPPPIGYQMNVPYAYPLPSGPPPAMNLPASYWSGEHHNWDEES